MKLYWDNFDNLLNELWRLLGAPMINFVIISLFFKTTIVMSIDIIQRTFPQKYISSQTKETALNSLPLNNIYPNSDSNISNFFSFFTSFSLDDYKSLVDTSTSTIIVFFILFSIVIFILDNISRFIGAMIPLRFLIIPHKIVLHEQLEQVYQKVLSILDVNVKIPKTKRIYHFHRYDAWQIAKNELDQKDHLVDYNRKKLALRSKIAQLETYFDYIKAYILLSIVSFIISFYFSLNEDNNINVSSSLFNLIFSIIILCTCSMFFYRKFFASYVIFIYNDLETYYSLNYKTQSKAVKKKFQQPTIRTIHDCINIIPKSNYITTLKGS